MSKHFLKAVLLLFLQISGVGAVLAQTQTFPPVQYETRIALPNSAETLFVDEVVFRWSIGAAVQQAYAQALADGDTSFVVSAADLEDFSMKLDDSTPLVGGVYIDEIIIGSVPQDRALADVMWEFDLINMELIAFQNTSAAQISTTTSVEFQVSSGGVFGSEYEIVTYAPGEDKSWPLARDAAEAAGGRLAIIESAEEDELLHDLVRAAGGRESWVGGLQVVAPQTFALQSVASETWEWLNGTPIPLGRNADPYSNWLPGEPNNQGGSEDFMAINLRGEFGWNDESNLNNIGSYIIEYAAAIVVRRYVDGEPDASETEERIDSRTALITEVTVRNLPTPLGPGTVFDIEVFEQEALNVVQAGFTDADFCVAPDPRERLKDKGKGRGNGTFVFNKRDLPLAALAGTGTCTGLLDFPDEDYDSWEQLLGDIDLIMPSRFRGYRGRVDLTPEDGDFSDAVEAVWLVLGVVRSTAEFDGPVATVGFPENLVDYGATPLAETPGCDRLADWRSVGIGGTVPQFGEAPNVEGNTMITQTVQCNRSWELTRRTTHVFPLRVDGPGNSKGKELEHIRAHFDGIAGTINEAEFCANSELIAELRASLQVAENSIVSKQYQDGIDALENLAVAAYLDDDYAAGRVVGFNACPIAFNYRGNLSSRGFAAAFALHDRFLNADSFVLYDPTDDPVVAEIFGLLKPDLRELP